jgi:DNA modification methylase
MSIKVFVGDCRQSLLTIPDASIHTCVTSPPYFGLRDYGVPSQIGLEQTPQAFVDELVAVFREVRRVLRDDGTVWLNLGDSYGSGKQLLGIPWRVALALQDDGWLLRQDIIWHKPNPMPESVRDRCTKAHEYIFLLAKSERYYFNSEAIAEPSLWFGKDKRSGQGNIRYQGKRTEGDPSKNGQQSFVTVKEKRNKRSVWTITTKAFKGAHFATFPSDLIEPCVLAGSPVGGTVLDPFAGSGTTGLVAGTHSRSAILCELNPEYAEMTCQRLQGAGLEISR